MKKNLRLPPDRFHSKVTAIKESKNIESIKVEELVGFLMTYELHLHMRKNEKGFGVAFKAKDVEEEADDEECVGDEHMTMLTK